MKNKNNQELNIEEFNASNEKSLIYHLAQITDFRKEKGRQHKLLDCLMLIVWGFMSGLTTMREIARSAKFRDQRDQVFTTSLNLKHGLPSHDTLSRIMRQLDPEALDTAFLNWINSNFKDAGFHLAIDGKAVRASQNRKGGKRKPPYIVNVVETSTKVVFAQLEIKTKNSEKTGIPAIIRTLNEKYPKLIQGMTISIDALAMTPKTIEACKEANASLLAPIKKNQKGLLEDVKFMMDSVIKQAKESHVKGLKNPFGSSLSFVVQLGEEIYPLDFDNLLGSVESESKHGRRERRVYATYVLEEDERLDRFEAINSITKVIRFREENRDEDVKRKYCVETTYYQCMAPMDAKESQETVKDHWIVETCNYYLDCNMGEDASTATKKAALPNLAILRRAALNILTITPALNCFSSLKDKQAYCRENPDLVFESISRQGQLEQSMAA